MLLRDAARSWSRYALWCDPWRVGWNGSRRVKFGLFSQDGKVFQGTVQVV